MASKIFLGSSCVHVSVKDSTRVYVCNSSALIDGQLFSETAEGPTLEAAKQNSVHKLGDLIKQNTNEKMGSNQCNALPPTNGAAKTMLNGGGHKPISDKQKQLIYDKARKQYKNPDDIAWDHCGKPVGELTGSEANSLIRTLIGG